MDLANELAGGPPASGATRRRAELYGPLRQPWHAAFRPQGALGKDNSALDYSVPKARGATLPLSEALNGEAVVLTCYRRGRWRYSQQVGFGERSPEPTSW